MTDITRIARQLVMEARAVKLSPQERYEAAERSHRGAAQGDYHSEKFGGGIILQHSAGENTNPTTVHHPEHGSVDFPWNFPRGVRHGDDAAIQDFVASRWKKHTGNKLDEKSLKAITSRVKQYMRNAR